MISFAAAKKYHLQQDFRLPQMVLPPSTLYSL